MRPKLTKLVKWRICKKSSRSDLTLKVTGILDTENLWSIPGIAADTLQPVQVIFVEDLRRAKQKKWNLAFLTWPDDSIGLHPFKRRAGHSYLRHWAARWLCAPERTSACQGGKSTGADTCGSWCRWRSSGCCERTESPACLGGCDSWPLSSHSSLCTDAIRIARKDVLKLLRVLMNTSKMWRFQRVYNLHPEPVFRLWRSEQCLDHPQGTWEGCRGTWTSHNPPCTSPKVAGDSCDRAHLKKNTGW